MSYQIYKYDIRNWKVYKIFGIGLSRTGTRSLAKAIVMLGYQKHRIKHLGGRSLDEFQYNYQFAGELFGASRYKLFDAYFPKARFILTVRDIDDWIKSIKGMSFKGPHTIKTRVDVPIGNKGPRIPLRRAEPRFKLYGQFGFDEQVFRDSYVRHYNDVMAHFEGREDKLLILDICGGEGWEKLCPFLGKEIPKWPFPHKHKTEH